MILKLRTRAQAAVAISLFAAVALGDGPAFSQSFTVGNGQDVGPQTMNNAGDTGTVDSGGIVETSIAGENAVQMLNSDQRLTNSGGIGTFGGGGFGVYSTGDNAKIISNGIILAGGAGAFGIVSEGDNANIVNSGLIATSGDGTFAIISDGSDAYVENSGTIDVSAGTIGGVGGIIGDKPNLTIVNSGLIQVEGDGALAIGWQSSSGLNLTNSGTIEVSGNGATAIGAGGNDIFIVNSGAVYAFGPGSTGIVTQVGNAVITNSGTIFNDFNDSTSTAISFGASNATLNLLAGTAIQGPIVFNGSGNTVSFGPALNAAMTFSGSGGVPQTILTGGRPFVVNGNQVAVVDITGFASAGSLVEDLTDAVTGVVETRLATPHNDVLGPRSGPDAWLSTFGAVRSQDGSGAAAGFTQALGGVVVGAERRSDDGFLGGVFVGAAAGQTEVDDSAQEITHRSVFGGGYLGYDAGQRFANLSFIAGALYERSSRQVANNLVLGGIETARADFNGTFISPALTLGTRLPVAMGTLMPSVRLRYAGLFVGDYTETGSAADLAVARRDVHLFEVRGQLALALPQVTTPTQAWQTTLRAGLDGIAQSSGDVSATLLGQDISFASGEKKTAVRGFAGADVAAAVGHGVMLDSGFEVGYGSDNAFTARGQVRLSKAF